MKPEVITLIVNGRTHYTALMPNVTLLQALRDLGYTDVKNGCEKGDCGACAVLIDGQPMNSCLTLAWQADGIPCLRRPDLARWIIPTRCKRHLPTSAQCSADTCTGGLIIAAKALLAQNRSRRTKRSGKHIRQPVPLHRIRTGCRGVRAAAGSMPQAACRRQQAAGSMAAEKMREVDMPGDAGRGDVR